MGKRAATVQEWFSLNQEELIQCPHQLGNLKITKSSCLKQRRRSGDWVFGTAPDNYILFAFEMHLKVCQQCDRIEAVSAHLTNESASTGRRFQKMGRPSGNNQRLRIKEARTAGAVVKSRKEQAVGNDLHYRGQHQHGF